MEALLRGRLVGAERQVRHHQRPPGGPRHEETEEAYDREVEVEAKEHKLEGLDKFTAKAGEKIEFKLENEGTTEHELEVFGPDGKEVGEVSPVKPGATGEAVITLAKPGTYTYKCGIGDHADKGMKGSFTVS
ncbi:cupredoxin domain-containing protein [Streptomyces sp. NPDC059460]|uniref:cupredoxin domain-containing protein n=1 Tax=Streptomyces sp. NPDC059460 TaxID=3346840 RepID=UPI0036A96DCE